ncbi:Chymotrypsin BI [Portunus trituberculatus]|uniref:Chymotrypsin BI n=1 Tax=Portunus trituberculatus TaxID=210409 RepID=A0A5B7HBP1_PORTR|nr:Chymotrypsin BI [Portunus trituberculatus]
MHIPTWSTPFAVTDVQAEALSNTECKDIFGNFDDSVVCVKKLSSQEYCQDDSGAPLQNAGNTYGISSFGSSAGCEAGLPTAFTRVFHFLDWIEAHTGIAYAPIHYEPGRVRSRQMEKQTLFSP